MLHVMRLIRYDFLTNRRLFFCSGCELSTPVMFAKLCNNKFLLFKEQTGDWLTEEKSLYSSSCSLARLLCGTRHQSISELFENSSLSHSWETISDAKKKKQTNNKENPRARSLWTTATNRCCAGGFSPSNNTHPPLCRPAPQRETDVGVLGEAVCELLKVTTGCRTQRKREPVKLPSIQITWQWTLRTSRSFSNPPPVSQWTSMLESFVSVLVWIH